MTILSCLTILSTIMLLRMMVGNKKEVLCRVQCSTTYLKPSGIRAKTKCFVQLLAPVSDSSDSQLTSRTGDRLLLRHVQLLASVCKHISGPPFEPHILLLLLCFSIEFVQLY